MEKDDDHYDDLTMEMSLPLQADIRAAVVRKQIVVMRGTGSGARYPIAGTVTIGRGAECVISLDDDRVSRLHARVESSGSRTLITDLGSRNGTKVNGMPVHAPTEIQFGDRLEIGPGSTLLFTHDDPLEAAARDSARMANIGRIAAGVSHDFNNLISAALATVATVEGRAKATRWRDEDAIDALRDLQLVLSRASELTKTLSTLGRHSDARGAVDVSRICQEVTRLCQRTFGEGYRLECDAPKPVVVQGSRTALHQILLNLCLNARDAMPQGGSIVLRAQRLWNKGKIWAQIDVVDEGEGMDADVSAHIFEPFFTTKPEGRGTGLGLATVGELVQGMDGSIGVQSAPGRGTTFRIRLPGLEAERAAPRPKRQTQSGSSPRPDEVLPGRIIVADDELNLRKSLVRLLVTDGHEVVSACNGADALELLESQGPRAELLLLDLDMPVMGGREVLEAIRGLSDAPAVILMSGHWDPERANELLALGANEYLSKPFQIAELRKLVVMVLAAHRRRAR